MEIGRSTKIYLGLGLAAAVLLGKLFYIQIIDDRYKVDALNNSIVYETIYPSRGIIYDRNGQELVNNVITYDILVTPREVQAFDTLALSRALGIEEDYIRNKMAWYRKYRTRIGYQSQVFLKQVDAETYLRFAETQYRFPGFRAQMRNSRNYPFNAGGNLLGYVSEVDASFLKKHPEYRTGDFVGRTGFEAAREEELRGEKGYHIYLRDSRNRVLKSYRDGAEDKMAVPGTNITTTIDAHLQQYGQELMRRKKGSLIAIEPSTGEILSLISSPGIDVEVLADIGHYWDSLAADPGKPMFNRAVQASYPPGSVFKLVNGLIGLQEGVLKEGYKYPCDHGYWYTPTKKLGCHDHKSPINLIEAVKMSCNAYFCFVLKNILENTRYSGIEEAFSVWEDYVRSFGFGAPLDSEVPHELGGTIPTADRYNRIYGKGHWRASSVISLSIGQGEIGVTPLQIANLGATLANRGWYIPPHIIKDDTVREARHTLIDPKNFDPIVEGMWQAVNSTPGTGGTATLAAIPGLDVCGKTGTAENPHGADHSVFICFAPRENPQIAVACYVENAGFGASWACPIASLMVEKYLCGDIRPSRKWLERYVTDADLMNVPYEKKKRQ